VGLALNVDGKAVEPGAVDDRLAQAVILPNTNSFGTRQELS
jgi:hypothetical protein